jgi:FKBP-type peptidyl-prolyl cis-trans isomerase
VNNAYRFGIASVSFALIVHPCVHRTAQQDSHVQNLVEPFKQTKWMSIVARCDGKKEMADFQQTRSGLKYRDIRKESLSNKEERALRNSEVCPKSGDIVIVHYIGWLEGFDSEHQFDNSYDRGSPIIFQVGVGQVVPGWDEGLLTNLRVGDQRELIIPSSLGYGDDGVPGVIPPNSTLFFRIELLGVHPINR